MPSGIFNGVQLYYDEAGSRKPMVLVHGSWVDRNLWGPIVPMLAERFRVVAYDRRGHSDSERPNSQGSLDEDADDLAALIEGLEMAPAHVVANSQGCVISLRLAAKRPELFRGLCGHEPPLFDALGDENPADYGVDQDQIVGAVVTMLEDGDLAGGSKAFLDVVVGSGMWEMLPDVARQTFIRNAPTFIDEIKGEDVTMADLVGLDGSKVPILLSNGTTGPPFFRTVVERLVAAIPGAQHQTVEGAGHVPHMTHAQAYVDVVTAFAESCD